MANSDLKSSSVPATGLVALPQFEDAERGSLGVAECGAQVPFAVARAFYLYDLPADAARGGHAHRETQQFLICPAGAMEISLWDRDGRRSITLDSPAMGLYVAPMCWLELSNLSDKTVCLVLASAIYDDADYIRNRAEFTRLMSVK
jgi:hypothetical protein